MKKKRPKNCSIKQWNERKKLAYFIESSPRLSPSEDKKYKTFILKLEKVHFYTIEPYIKFKDVKDKMIKMAKDWLDNAELLTEDEFNKMTMDRFKNIKFELEEETKD